MGAVTLPAIYRGSKPRVDRSFVLTFETRELTSAKVAQLHQLFMSECWLVIAAAEGDATEADIPDYKPDSGVGEKSPAQRLRGVLYRLWEQQGKPDDSFNVWYMRVMERLIDGYKAKLDGDVMPL